MYVWLSKVNQITQGGIIIIIIISIFIISIIILIIIFLIILLIIIIIIIIYYLTINNIPRFAFNDLLTFKTWPIWFRLNNINKSQQNISVV
jgi:hypothetical protein